MHVLIGKKLLSVFLDSAKHNIKFVCEGGEVTAQCDADCCSHTWVENVSLPALGLPATVLSVEDLDGLPEDKWDEDQCGLTQFYGLKIVTDRGELLLDYRNESNGYYGGSLCWPGDLSYYGGVYEQQEAGDEWTEVA